MPAHSRSTGCPGPLRGMRPEPRRAARGWSRRPVMPCSGRRWHRCPAWARSGQRRWGRQHAPPAIGLINNVPVVCVLLEQRCPAGERSARLRQCHRLPMTMLTPCNVQIFEQDSPGHRVNREVMDDQHELARRCHPQRTDHLTGGRIQSCPGRQQLRISKYLNRLQTGCRQSLLWDLKHQFSTRSRSIACRSNRAPSTISTSDSLAPAGACITAVWLN